MLGTAVATMEVSSSIKNATRVMEAITAMSLAPLMYSASWSAACGLGVVGDAMLPASEFSFVGGIETFEPSSWIVFS